MRTRLASVATAILLATAALAGTAGTALMATTVTNDVCGTPTTDMSYGYDSLSLLITTVTITNTSPTPETLTVELDALVTNAKLWSGSQAFNTGVKTYDVSGAGLHMSPASGLNFKGQPKPAAPPFSIVCSWSFS